MAGVSLVLDGKVALITGGSRGIGAETVRLFVEAGARVAFGYRQAWEQAKELQAECGGSSRCVAIEQDLSTPANGRALVAAAVEAFGRLDVLVANHGIWSAEDVPIELMAEEQWRRTMAVNLDSVFGLVQAAVTQMELQALSRRLRMSWTYCPHQLDSRPARRGIHADYAVTKGALISLTKSLSSELAPRGIRVNCVAPGWVATDMSSAALGDPGRARIAGGIPVGRVASAREIAGPVLFLCTPLAGFISGEVLNVNGGAVLVG